MAVKREVEIILKAKDDTKKGLDSAKKSTDGLGKSTDKLKTSLADIPLGYAAITAAVVALGVAYDRTIALSGEYQKSILEITTLTGATAAETEALSKELRSLSVVFGQVDTVMAKANYNVVSAGFGDVADSLIIMDVASKAAIGGLTDVNTAAKVITQTLNAYGQGSEYAEKVAGDLFATVKGGVTTFEELSSSLGQVTGVAAAANVPFEEVSAAMALLTKNGANSAMAATSLAALIVELGAATGESKVLLDEMGISLDRGLGPALVGLSEATGESLDQLVKLLPNIRAVRAAASAASNSGQDFADQLAAMSMGVDDFNSAYEIMAASYQQSADNNAAAAKRFKTAIGDTGLEGKQILLDMWTEGLVFMADIVEENSEGLTTFATNIGTVAGALAKATAGAIGFVYWAGEKINWALTAMPFSEAADGLEEYGAAALKTSEEIRKLVDSGELMAPLFDLSSMGVSGDLPVSDLQKQLAEKVKLHEAAREEGRKQAEAAAREAEAAAEALAASIQERLFSEAEAMGVDLFKTIFSPESGTYTQIAKTAEELATEITAKLNEALGRKIIAAPKIGKDMTAAGAPLIEDNGEVQLIEDIIEADRLLQEQLRASSAENAEAQRANLELLLAERQAIEDLQDAHDKRIAQANQVAHAMGRVGAATTRAFLNGENAAKAFGNAIKTEIISAIVEAIAKMIILSTFKFLTGGVSGLVGLKDGGQVPKMAQGGKVPGAAFGYSVPDGIRGKDSQMIMAMPGEEVINRQMSRRLNRFLSAVESSSYASPWDMGGGGSGGSTVVMNVGIPQSQAGLVTMQQSVTEMLEDREKGSL